MTLPALATIADVAAIVGRDLSASEQTAATRLLDMASGMVRRYTRQTLTRVENDSITLAGNWGHVLTLPQRPVQSVQSVTFAGNVQPVTAWRLVGDDLFLGTGAFMPDYGSMLSGNVPALFGPAGSKAGPIATGATWQGPMAQITVVYTHGYAEVPQDIVNEVAGMVALQLSTSVGVVTEKIGTYEVRYLRGEGGGMTLTDATKQVLNFYRKRAISSPVRGLL